MLPLLNYRRGILPTSSWHRSKSILTRFMPHQICHIDTLVCYTSIRGLLTIRLAVQQSHNVLKIKDRLNQKLSALLLLVRNSSDPSLLLSAEDHINSASSLLNLTETKSVAQNAQQISKSPANKHIATQRGFFTTKKKRKPQH